MLVAEALRSLGANISTTVAATMTVLIGMFLLGLFIALGTWVAVVVEPREAASSSCKVYFCTHAHVRCTSGRERRQVNAVRRSS